MNLFYGMIFITFFVIANFNVIPDLILILIIVIICYYLMNQSD